MYNYGVSSLYKSAIELLPLYALTGHSTALPPASYSKQVSANACLLIYQCSYSQPWQGKPYSKVSGADLGGGVLTPFRPEQK